MKRLKVLAAALTSGVLLTVVVQAQDPGGANSDASSAQEESFGCNPLQPISLRAKDRTRVLVLATIHLREVVHDDAGLSGIASLVSALERFKPDIIAVERLSGETVETLERLAPTYDGVLESFASNILTIGKPAQKALNLDRLGAEARLAKLLDTFEGRPAEKVLTSDRIKAALLLVAAYDLTAAALQWSYVPSALRTAGDTLPGEVADGLTKALASRNEDITIGVALAHRLGHQRVYAIDDQSDALFQINSGRQLMAELSASPEFKKLQESFLFKELPKRIAAATQSGDLLGLYRWINSSEYGSDDLDAQWHLFLRSSLPSGLDRERAALWEARNLAIAGNSALEPNFLYRGNGDGTFTKITDGDIVTTATRTGGAVWGDYDNDGDADLFVPNGNKPDVLYRNDGNFTFTAMPTSVIEDDHRYSIAGAWGDYDNDGYLDLYVANMYGGANALFHNKGDGRFERVHTGPPVVDGGHSYAVSWSDWDNDGYLDLLAGNWGAAPVPYLNESGWRFVRADAGDLGTQIAVASSIAWADFDNDGDVDVCLGSWPNSPGPDERNMLYRNEGTARSWLKVRLRGTKSNLAAIGARLTLRARINGRLETQIREVVAHTGWRSQSDLAQHFGLGDAKSIEEIVVRWACGTTTRHANIKANQMIEVVESP